MSRTPNTPPVPSARPVPPASDALPESARTGEAHGQLPVASGESRQVPEVTDWKAEARKWEQRAKENSSAAARLAELEDADKSEQQKLAEQLQTAQGEAAQFRSQALRLKVAAAKGVPAELVDRLVGECEEDLARDADTLLAALGSPQTPTTGASAGVRVPVHALRPGALPSAPEPTLADQIAAAEKAGDWPLARRLKTHQLMELAQHNQ